MDKQVKNSDKDQKDPKKEAQKVNASDGNNQKPATPKPEETKKPEENKKPAEKERFPLKRAREVFKSHPKAEKIYFTSEDTCFINPQFARMHAENLEDKKILIVNKNEVE